MLILIAIIQKLSKGTTAFPLLILKTIRIVLGIRSKELQTRRFCRLTWLFFVMWFFTLRTIYVTEMIEFAIFGVRRPEIKTVDELRDKNIRLIVPKDLLEQIDIDSDGNIFGYVEKI